MFLLKVLLSSSTLLSSQVSTFKIITLNSLLDILLISLSLIIFLRFCFILSFEASSVSPFWLSFCVCFYRLCGTATSPKLEVMILCMVIPYVDCVCLVTFAAWLELWLVWSGCPGTFHTATTLSGQVKSMYAEVFWCSVPGRTVEAEVGASQDAPGCSMQGLSWLGS